MKKSYWLFSLALVSTLLFIEYDLTKRTHQQNALVASQKVTVPAANSAAPIAADSSVIVVGQANESFDQKFNQVSDEITRLQNNPEQTEKKLQKLASTMSTDDVKKMSQVMSNSDVNGDQRAMAVELLSRKQTVESLKQLENFVQQHQNTTKWSRGREFESVLRAQAIEGIAAFPQKDLAMSSLLALDPKLDEAFLKDRIQRSIVGLKNESQTPEKQDNKALSQLVE